MKDRRVLPNGEIEEWERPRTIPDDFIYDPVRDGYLAPGEYADESDFPDFEAFCERIDKIREEMRAEGGPHLISADELRALKVEESESPSLPQKSRKKPKAQPDDRQRDLFSDLVDAEDNNETAE